MDSTTDCADGIRGVIVGVIKAKFLQVKPELLGFDGWDMPLTGSRFRLDMVDLVYLLFEIEKTIGVRFCDKALAEYGFNTINGIVKAVEMCKNNQTINLKEVSHAGAC